MSENYANTLKAQLRIAWEEKFEFTAQNESNYSISMFSLRDGFLNKFQWREFQEISQWKFDVRTTDEIYGWELIEIDAEML
jgi:hypothetical protein